VAKRITKALSDVQLRKWIAAGRPVAKADGDGLTFTLSAGGVAAWVLRYRIGGRRKELTLGRYPDMPIKDARNEASEKRAQVNKGVDVGLEKQRLRTAQAGSWTVRELVRDYERKVAPGLAPITLRGRTGLLTNLVNQFGTFSVSDVTYEDAHAWLDMIAQDRGYHAANNTRKAAMAVFRHALARRRAKANPFGDVEMSTVAARPETRKRIKLDANELKVFLAGLKKVDETDALAWRVILVTGVRAGEMISAEWADIDLAAALWRIPRAKIKTRADMREDHFAVPLPPESIAWLTRLHQLAAGSRWVLPARASRGGDKPADHERVLARLKNYTSALDGCRPIVLHDLRSTMRSHLTSTLNVRVEVAERCLNHKLAGLLGIYDANDYIEERTSALARWAAYLSSIEAGGNVVALRRAQK
jgi:integrase